MDSYVLNKRSGILHKLPASESCNTDQIDYRLRFEIHASEQVVTYLSEAGHQVRLCRRCFAVLNHIHPIAHDSMYEHDGYGHHSHPPS